MVPAAATVSAAVLRLVCVDSLIAWSSGASSTRFARRSRRNCPMAEYLEFVVYFLFDLTGGVPLIETIWILPWIMFWTLVMVLVPLGVYGFLQVRSRSAILSAIAYIFMVSVLILALFTVLSPVKQHQQLKECRTVTATVQDESFAVTQCRSKQNINGEFGEWGVFFVN